MLMTLLTLLHYDFLDLLDSFGCTQHVFSPTHSAGHILDLVITSSSNAVNNVSVGNFLSDHALIMFDVNISKPHTQSIMTVVNGRNCLCLILS